MLWICIAKLPHRAELHCYPLTWSLWVRDTLVVMPFEARELDLVLVVIFHELVDYFYAWRVWSQHTLIILLIFVLILVLLIIPLCFIILFIIFRLLCFSTLPKSDFFTVFVIFKRIIEADLERAFFCFQLTLGSLLGIIWLFIRFRRFHCRFLMNKGSTELRYLFRFFSHLEGWYL